MHRFGFALIFSFSLCSWIDGNDLEILSSGLAKLQQNDMLIQFIVTLKHHGQKPRNVFATMIECCEKITEDDIDCESFRVYDDYVRIAPGMYRNLTLIYPNVYVYNRKGSCLLSIWHRIVSEERVEDKPIEMRHRIPFDTTIVDVSDGVPPVLEYFYDPQRAVKCETKDLDPFAACSPVNCHMKYSGFRNYYNPKRKRCQKVPICVGNPRKKMADIVYVPTLNACRDLEKKINEEDIADLVEEKIKNPELDLDSTPVNIQCHHGEIDVRTGLCVCDWGWKSEPYDPDSGMTIYHMCSVQCKKSQKRFPMTFFLVGFFVATWMAFCVCICEKYRFASQFMRKISCLEGECSCLRDAMNG